MLFTYRFAVSLNKLVVMGNVCLATIEAANTVDGWVIASLSLMEDDSSVSFRDRHIEPLPKSHWLWPVVSADLLKKHKSEIAAKWRQTRIPHSPKMEPRHANS